MNSTNVPSNKDNPAVVVGQSIPTDKGLEMPPKTAKWGVSEKEVKEAEKQGEIVISQVEESKVREDGMLEKKDGTTISMVNPKAYQALKAIAKQKEEMAKKAAEKKNGITITSIDPRTVKVMQDYANKKEDEKKVQSGMEIG